jgi:hypothetical protein
MKVAVLYESMKAVVLDDGTVLKSRTDWAAKSKEIARMIRSGEAYGKHLGSVALNLEGEDFRGVLLGRASFRGANFRRANFEGANLASSNFFSANLSGANLKNATLDGGEFANVNFSGANFQDAEISANFSGSNFTNANLKGADLRYADLSNVEGLESVKYDAKTKWPKGFTLPPSR